MFFFKVASKVGILITINTLTASKSKITFACVYVQESSSSSPPNLIKFNLNDSIWDQEVAYN